jgi:hypothetical protein
MYKTVCSYQEKKEAVKKQRSKLFDEEKYDEGTALVKAFEEEHPFPYTDGAMKAYWAYQNMNYHGADCFEVEDLPWEKDMKDFAETLRDAGIDAISSNRPEHRPDGRNLWALRKRLEDGSAQDRHKKRRLPLRI